jgi:pimeloyl-ACP methyl ester carboxylesterase
VGVALAALTVLLVAALGGAWYASGRLMEVVHVHDTYPLRVLAVNAKNGTVTVDRGQDATEPGTFRLAWHGGQATIGTVLSATRAAVRRRIYAIHGPLRTGTAVGIEPGLYTGNPMTALRLRFFNVSVPTPLGGMPAWYLPGRRSTWVILIHGLGGSRTDTLAPMPTLHSLGYPMLAITYRNDVGAPQGNDHDDDLGASEWHDVASAVGYALAHGASDVVLYGYSLGGAMALIVARDPTIGRHVRAVVLDSPLLDWPATLNYAAERQGIPQPFAALVERVLAWRAGIDYSQFDQLAHERELRVPILLFQGTSDTIVPPRLAAQFAHGRPELITYVPIAGADHVSGIDTDPTAYMAALIRFLAR